MAMAKTKTQTQTQTQKAAVSFTKEALLFSNEFKHQKDLLMVVLEDGKTYTKDEVRGLLDKTLNRKVEI